MKVLNIINAKKPFVLAQIQALKERGVDSTTICVPGEYYAGGDEIQGRSPWDYLRFYPTVLSQIRDDYDVIHAHYGLTAPLALAQPKRPVVLSLWGRDLFGPYGPVSKASARFCDAVLVRSEEMQRELGVKSYIIERGVDIDTFHPIDQETARNRVGWDTSGYHILFPYSPKRKKKNYPLAEQVTDKLQEALSENVILHTIYNEPHDLIPYYMNAADLLLMTSTPKSEGSPNTVKECMACNTPVVSTSVGDVRSLLEGVENSRVGNDLEELVGSSLNILTSEEMEGGREKVISSLTWDNTSDQIIEVYNRIT